jgi:L-ornithine Nalpha-acyltransferase
MIRAKVSQPPLRGTGAMGNLGHRMPRAQAFAPRNLISLFRPGMTLAGAGFVPALRAYSGLRVPEARSPNPSQTLGRLGSLEVRLAGKAAEVRRAQKLRYRVFYQEMSAIADAATMLARRDVDGFDAISDHLLVVDHAVRDMKLPRGPSVVGTYRMLRQSVAEQHGGFYSAAEFDIDPLIARHPTLKFLEVGRSCVLAPYRNKRTVELLWHGIWTYVLRNGVDVMIGCASLDGTDPERIALQLAFLHHYAAAPPVWHAAASPERTIDMNRMPKAAVDPKAALRLLPPLIKGYLRLGAFVGEGAVIDYQFGTTDVLIVLPVAEINSRYIEHFGPAANRHAA